MTPRLRNPAHATTRGINCAMSAGFEVILATAEELPLLTIKLNIPEPINPAYTWLVLYHYHLHSFQSDESKLARPSIL
ncbi:MAG: hypothetical protein M3044_03350 [Thermoproteota archaeon]|nr:hypothetical protein [Thermoproteota archaeon]